MYKSFVRILITLNHIKKSIKFIISQSASFFPRPYQGEDAAKRQVRVFAKRKSQRVSLSLPFFPLSCQREGRVRAFAKRNRKASISSQLSFPFAVLAGLTRNLCLFQSRNLNQSHQLREVSNV
jgi:hypothetical protein